MATITLRAVGVHTDVAAAVTPLAPAAPAGVAASDLSILVVQGKRAVGATAPTVTTPTGWTLIAATHSTTALAPANDTGTNSVFTYYREGTYTAPSVVTTGFNSAGAVIVAYQKSGGGWNLPPTVTNGSDTTSAADGAIAGAAGLALEGGDLMIAAAGLSGDIGTVSAQAFTGTTGATLGTVTNHVNFAVTTGNDSRTLVSDVPVTAGTSNAAPTFTFTNASATTGHGQFIRLRAGAVLASYSVFTGSFDYAASTATLGTGTGDMDLRLQVSVPSWIADVTLVGKVNPADGTQLSWKFNLHPNGRPHLSHTLDGVTLAYIQSSAALTVADGAVAWLRFTLDVDNGASGNDGKFFTSTDGSAWTQLGTTITNAGVLARFNSSTPFVLASTVGKYTRFQARTNILDDGTGVVANFDAAQVVRTATRTPTSYTDSTGLVWTPTGSNWDWVAAVEDTAPPATSTIFRRIGKRTF